MEISEKFAERLRQRREHCGLTQERLSAISGVQQELIRLLERIFPAHFGESRAISESYLHSCLIL
jgi:transcriptional regulator with XRE-family HTH domain